MPRPNIKNYPRLSIAIGIILLLALVGGLIFVIFFKPTSDKFKLRKEYFNCTGYTNEASDFLVLKSCPSTVYNLQNELSNLYGQANANELTNTPSVCDGTSPSKSPTISRLPSQITSPMASIMPSPLGSQKSSPRASQTNTSQTPCASGTETCAPGMRYSATATPDEPFVVNESDVFCPTSAPSVDKTRLYGPGDEFTINTLRTFQMRCSVRTNVVDGRGTITQTMVLLQKDTEGGLYVPKAKTIITDYVPGALPDGDLASVDLSDNSAMSHMSLVFSRWLDSAAGGSTYWMDGCKNTNWTDTDCRIDSSSNSAADGAAAGLPYQSPWPGCTEGCNGTGSLSNLILLEYNSEDAPAAFGMFGAETRDSQDTSGYFQDSYCSVPSDKSQVITQLLSNGNYVIKTPVSDDPASDVDTGGGISGLWQIAYQMKNENTPTVRNFPVVSTYSANTVGYSEPVCSATGSAIGTKLTFNGQGPRSYLLATPETGMTDATYNALIDNPSYYDSNTFSDIAESYQFVDLRNLDMIFEVDMSSGTTDTGTGAGCDLALYWANMHWMAIDKGTPGACGDYYCDANANFSLCGTCPDRVNTKDNNYYFCTEMDILEGNMYGIHNTPHMCYEEGTPATYRESATMCTDPDNSYGYAVPTRWTGTKCDAFGFSAGNTGTGIVSSLIPYSSSNDVGCPQPTSDVPRVCGSEWTGMDWGTSANQH